MIALYRYSGTRNPMVKGLGSHGDQGFFEEKAGRHFRFPEQMHSRD